MSFLANLRQQQDNQTFCLCYLLSYDALDGRLQLDLSLHNVIQGPVDLAKPYRLQRAHLQNPPAFFSEKDRALLNTLLEMNPSWLSNHQLELPPSTDWTFLKSVIETGHCYFKHSGHLKPVDLGDTQSAQPYWLLNPSAHYQLRWRLTQDAFAQYIPLQRDLLYVNIKAKQVVLGCTTTPLDQNEQRDYSDWQRLSVAVDCAKSDPKLAQIPLTLPDPPRFTADTGQLKAMLYCESCDDTGGRVTLLFTLGNDDYCSLPRRVADPMSFTERYWTGGKLYQLNTDAKQYTKIKNAVIKLLGSFASGHVNHGYAGSGQAPSYEWRPQHEHQWQTLFIALYEPLQALDVQFSFDKQFQHRYLTCEGWGIQVQDLEGGLLLNIELQSRCSAVPLQEILSQLREYNLRNHEGHFQLPLKEGRILLLSERDAKGLMEEFGDLRFNADGFYLDRAQSYRLAQLQNTLDSKTEWSGNLETLQQAIAINQSPVVLDSHFTSVNAHLRPYQWLGVCWIHHLKKNGFNGLLADDMGLGKTLQVITLLAFEKQQSQSTKPALVVVPLSLVHNWVSEIDKFAPQLSVHVMHGSKRHQQWSELQTFDVLITTYQSIAIDLNQWQQQALSWLILDEAQHIKNPTTRWSQAVREIPCGNKLCLSGTPVENHLGELWAILDFLMPGCLNSREQFKRYYRNAIEVEGNGERMAQLLARVAPFMLRRTKNQIAKDLPPKTEIKQLIPLEQAQRDFYEGLKQDACLELQSRLDDPTQKGQNSIAALAALLKLRQACCDPALFPGITLPSAKKAYCIDMIAELVAEGRAVLVFSQFTTMLTLLETELDQRQIKNLMLTGNTRKRQDVVDAFQQGDAPVLLISLKAGGTGLNLTRADTVIHYDPWWNAAVEKQASDRAHRIGQDKPVFIYKLITEDTIEEKIEKLQQQKTMLSNNVDQQAQITATHFALKFEELLSLLHKD